MEINWKNIRCKNCTKQIYMTRGGGIWFHMETSQSGCIMHGDHRAEPDMSEYFPDASLLTEARQALEMVLARSCGCMSPIPDWHAPFCAVPKCREVLARLREREGVKP